ncbi:MFS transporter [Botryobacter ruber]|uniref:MFS transporter n=1 Tax=Botryobacter ruber TaxID=2171629 RepID=UPI000E0C4FFB|nr:MFS transporter [Botryobacter ruber]
MLAFISPTTIPSRRAHRLAVGSFFFLQGLCFASWGSRIPTIQQQLGLTETELGMVLFALPLGQILSLPFAGWLIARAGSHRVVVPAALVYPVSLLFISLAWNVLQLLAALFIFGIASNLINIAVNTQAVGVEKLYRKPIMASLHGLWSLAGFVGAAIGTFMIGKAILPQWHFLVIMGFVFVGVALCARYVLHEESNAATRQPLFAKPDRYLVSLGVLAFCCLVCEGAMFDWSGVYFKKVVKAEKAWIGAGYTAFMCTMATGRFVADYVTSRIGIRRMLQLNGILMASGLTIAVVFPNLLTAIAGFLLVGAGVSAVVPLVYSAAGRSKVMAPGVALATVSTIGFVGFLLGPPLIGLVAGASSLRISFAIIAVLGLCVSLIASRIRSFG